MDDCPQKNSSHFAGKEGDDPTNLFISSWGYFTLPKFNMESKMILLVVSTQLKNISQVGSFPQVGVKIKNI